MTLFNRFSAILLPLLFFVVTGLLPLYDYGMNWDSPIHFARGQAYLRYILTGKTNYSDLPSLCRSEYNSNSRIDATTGEVCDRHRKVRVSEYESHLLDFKSWAVTTTYGHPAFSNIMLAISNNIFFKYLGLVEDVPAYHLYNITTMFLLALTVSIWARKTFGTFASIVAVLAVYTFPLLFAEQHFNVKDPPMAAFFIISLYFFWLSFTKKRILYLILSALAGGASFGTKFNFVFAPFILFPWFAAYLFTNRHHLKQIFSKRMLLALTIYPIILFLVFFLTWPALWPDPLNNVFQVFKYYKNIGGPTCPYSPLTKPWLTECTQLISIKYFLYTTPPTTLFLFFVGSIVGVFRFKEKSSVIILWLTFFYFTILRVTFSITNIYGGLRQIMEFVPAMAMIAGIGALFLRELLIRIAKRLFLFQEKNKKLITLLASFIIILGYIPIFLELKQIHPNQNVYFNFIIGGLKGAAEKDFPGYGNTYGNAYLQGIKWINQNAEKRAKLALVSGNAQNISRLSLREDIDFSNGSRSGYNQEGEYQMALVVGQDIFSNTFRHKYLDNFLNEVYVVRVDGVPVLKIWKNDKQYLKEGLNIKRTSEQFKKTYSVYGGKKEILISLYRIKRLKALTFSFPSSECKDKLIGATVYVSTDGDQYFQKEESVNNFSAREIAGYNADFVFLFPGDDAQYIRLVSPVSYPCDLSNIDLQIFTFRE